MKQVLEEVGDEDGEILEDDNDEYLPNDSTTESELENHYQTHRRLVEVDDDDYDCNSDDDENELIPEKHLSYNKSTRETDDEDDDDDFEGGTHVDGIVGKMKTNRVKELEAQLTRDQLEEERRYIGLLKQLLI